MKFNFKSIKSRKRPYFIAEAGVNHECSISMAKKMIDKAKNAGADAIKFQTYKANKIAAKISPYYWDIKKEKTKSQYQLFSKYDHFNYKDYKLLSGYCKKKKIEFLSTPFDSNAVDFLYPLVNIYKISSSDITNYPLLEKVSSKRKPVILSTGASTVKEIRNALKIINRKVKKVILMHCILNYPTQNKDANLNMIRFLRDEFPHCIPGYSDHTLPNKDMSNLITAFFMGAKVIEKHFTLNKRFKGNDHYHSLDEKDLKNFNNKLDKILPTLGDYKKRFIKSEIKSRKNARRSLVLNLNLKKGHKLKFDDLIPKRPATGISPIHIKKILGKRLKLNLLSDTILQWKHIS